MTLTSCKFTYNNLNSIDLKEIGQKQIIDYYWLCTSIEKKKQPIKSLFDIKTIIAAPWSWRRALPPVTSTCWRTGHTWLRLWPDGQLTSSLASHEPSTALRRGWSVAVLTPYQMLLWPLREVVGVAWCRCLRSEESSGGSMRWRYGGVFVLEND